MRKNFFPTHLKPILGLDRQVDVSAVYRVKTKQWFRIFLDAHPAECRIRYRQNKTIWTKREPRAVLYLFWNVFDGRSRDGWTFKIIRLLVTTNLGFWWRDDALIVSIPPYNHTWLDARTTNARPYVPRATGFRSRRRFFRSEPYLSLIRTYTPDWFGVFSFGPLWISSVLGASSGPFANFVFEKDFFYILHPRIAVVGSIIVIGSRLGPEVRKQILYEKRINGLNT